MFVPALFAAAIALCSAAGIVKPLQEGVQHAPPGAIPKPNQTVKPISLQFDSVGIKRFDVAVFCAHRDTIQLGPCSDKYIKCDRYIQKVEYRACSLAKVFANGRCQDVADVAACKDVESNAANLETEQLAERQNLCKRAANSLYIVSAEHHCSRQGLLCDQNSQAHSFLCPVGQILDSKLLTCVPDKIRCTYVPRPVSAAIKQHLLRQHCARHSSQHTVVDPFAVGHLPAQQHQLPGYGTCDTWYVDCRANFQALIHCEPGRMYDAHRRICRAPSHRDHCQMETSCVGNEWNIQPAGRCNSEFVFCNGLKPKKFICDHGKVFHKGRCVPIGQSDCPLCEFGQVKASTDCGKYYQCGEDRFQRRVWNEKECPPGEGFSESEKKCVTDYACSKIEKCRTGASYKFSCTDYMVCLNGEYEYRACPERTSWNVKTSQCEYDPDCVEPGEEICREGDVIPSTNCQTYQQCQNGEFVKKWCEPRYTNDACAHCGTSENRVDQCEGRGSGNDYRYNDFKPVQCRHGDIFVNAEHCSEYVECLDGVWYTRVCPSGFVFDRASEGCRRSENGACGFNATSVYVPSREDGDDYKTDDGYVSLADRCDQRSKQRVADFYDCGKYKVCNLRSGFYEDRSCKYGEQFNPHREECVWGYQCNPNECLNGVKIPRPQCGKLQWCKNGVFNNYTCANNAVFENGRCSRTKFCSDYERSEMVNCIEGMTAEHSYDCSKYLLCFRGNLIERQCGGGRKFNPEYGRCEHSYMCKADRVPPCYHGEGRAVPEQCDKYERCQDNRFMLQSCPFGTIYNEHRMRCEPGTCRNEPMDEVQRGNVDEEEEPCTESPLPDGFKPHPTDCASFYQCAQGQWKLMNCKPGVVFNPTLAVCDWPRNVPGCD